MVRVALPERGEVRIASVVAIRTLDDGCGESVEAANNGARCLDADGSEIEGEPASGAVEVKLAIEEDVEADEDVSLQSGPLK
jgi:hypothetical protein